LNTLALEALIEEESRIKPKSDVISLEVIQGCIRKNKDSQKIVYEHYYKKMYAICYRYAGNSDDAKDLLQDGFIKLFDKLHINIEITSVDAWIRKLFTNHCLDFVRSAYKKYMVNQSEWDENMQDKLADTQEVSDTWLDLYESENILKALAQLRPDYRVVLNLYAVENLSHQEIADFLGIKHATSRSKLLRARASLKKILQKNGK